MNTDPKHWQQQVNNTTATATTKTNQQINNQL
jgi:hypothetical protein